MKRIFNFALRKTQTIQDPALRGWVSRCASVSVYSVVAIGALGTAGIDVSPLLATLGVGGATLGFACRDVGANLVAGLALAAQRPFVTGTEMSVGTSGSSSIRGQVHHWDMRYLYLKGQGGELIYVPNSTVFSSVIVVHNPAEEVFDDHHDDHHHSDHIVKSSFILRGFMLLATAAMMILYGAIMLSLAVLAMRIGQNVNSTATEAAVPFFDFLKDQLPGNTVGVQHDEKNDSGTKKETKEHSS